MNIANILFIYTSFFSLHIYNSLKIIHCCCFFSAPEPLSPMLPPVGLKAIVLSSSTVVLYWTDSTLSRSQLVTDNRFYTVRYAVSATAKYRYFNSTDLNCMIDDLRYESSTNS